MLIYSFLSQYAARRDPFLFHFDTTGKKTKETNKQTKKPQNNTTEHPTGSEESGSNSPSDPFLSPWAPLPTGLVLALGNPFLRTVNGCKCRRAELSFMYLTGCLAQLSSFSFVLRAVWSSLVFFLKGAGECCRPRQ